MISEAMGKILGMVMAYGVSSLGLLLAYVNYRKRILGAERAMSGTAWVVVATIVLVLGTGAWIVASLASPPPMPEAPGAADREVVATSIPEVVPDAADTSAARSDRADPPQWSLVGLLVPGAIFLFATWVTAALHRRFSTQRDPDPPPATPAGG